MDAIERGTVNLQALRYLSYGVYIIGSRKGDKLNAMIANTVFQITSEPPTVAVSINKNNLTHEFIRESRAFSASALCQETPLPFIGRFGFKSGRDANKLEGVEYKLGETKAPIVLENTTSFVEVRVDKEVDVGTHTIFIGEVVAADVVSEKTCMTYAYYQQVKRGVTPKTAPTYTEVRKVETRMPETKTARYKCTVCGYIYAPELGDPDGGIAPGTSFESLPDGWTCPVCGANKSQFEKMEE